MKHRQNMKWFFSGILTASIVISTFSPTLALFTKSIQVSPDVNLYVNDQKFVPKDYNGNPLESFIYNGTTYLPVRAVSEALDIPIQWDGNTRSVYIGKHTGDKPAVWVSELDYFDKDQGWDFNTSTKDNLGNEHTHSIVPRYGIGTHSVTYKLNGKYSHLSGLFFQQHEYRDEGGGKLSIYADGELIWQASVAAGQDPVEINLNIQNVKEITFSCKRNEPDQYTYVAIGELGLWT